MANGDRWPEELNKNTGQRLCVLDKLRGRVDATLLRLGRGAARIMPSPTSWTATGLVFSLLAAFLFSVGHPIDNILAGIMVLVSGFFDIVDGAVARSTNRMSKLGAFLDSTMDRIGESSIYLGILLGSSTAPLIVFLALAASMLVSYTRAKAEALSVNLAGVGIGERSERLIAITIAALFGLLPIGVLVVAALAIVTISERVVRVARSLK
ncbi:MAG: CDP-alcohol phosphatidyltransferase family protein [Thaumarchaeota archaeon]|nr:CDP-alcohol phosphatidyltransferase family protein [Nitrososphaerota archaeon]